jgi:hypothetical protein
MTKKDRITQLELNENWKIFMESQALKTMEEVLKNYECGFYTPQEFVTLNLVILNNVKKQFIKIS